MSGIMDKSRKPPRAAVIGAGQCGEDLAGTARSLGRLLAESGFEIVCGGLEGVMAAAAEGARSAGGLTIGILPGLERDVANTYIDVAVATGLGQLRNFLVVANGDVVLAVGGGAGTLSEIGHARKMGKTVIALGAWAGLPGVLPARGPEEAARLAREHLAPAGSAPGPEDPC